MKVKIAETLDFTRFFRVQDVKGHLEPRKDGVKMSVKEYLMQIQNKNGEIKNQEEYIQRLKDSLDIAGVSYDRERVQTSPDFDKFGKIYGQIDEEERKLEEMRNRLVETRVKIISQIHEIENDKFQRILNYVYVDAMTLNRTAIEMSFSYDYIKELHGQALQVFRDKFLLDTP